MMRDHVKPERIVNLKSRLSRFIQAAAIGLPEAITPALVQDHLASLDRAASTKAGILSAISQFRDYLIRSKVNAARWPRRRWPPPPRRKRGRPGGIIGAAKKLQI